MPSFLIVHCAAANARTDAFTQPPTLDVSGAQTRLDWGDVTVEVPEGRQRVAVFVDGVSGVRDGALLDVHVAPSTGTRLLFRPPQGPGAPASLDVQGQWPADAAMAYYAARDARTLTPGAPLMHEQRPAAPAASAPASVVPPQYAQPEAPHAPRHSDASQRRNEPQHSDEPRAPRDAAQATHEPSVPQPSTAQPSAPPVGPGIGSRGEVPPSRRSSPSAPSFGQLQGSAVTPTPPQPNASQHVSHQAGVPQAVSPQAVAPQAVAPQPVAQQPIAPQWGQAAAAAAQQQHPGQQAPIQHVPQWPVPQQPPGPRGQQHPTGQQQGHSASGQPQWGQPAPQPSQQAHGHPQQPAFGQQPQFAPEPGFRQAGFGQPGAGQPGVGQPGTGQPGVGQPGAGQPGTPQHPHHGQPQPVPPQPQWQGQHGPSFGQPQRPVEVKHDAYGRPSVVGDRSAPAIPTPQEFDSYSRAHIEQAARQGVNMHPVQDLPGQNQGWYTDPHRRADLRWFDGHRWTSSVMRGGQRGTDQV